MSKDYDYENEISMGVQNIGKILIDGRRVETLMNTTIPSGKGRSPQTRRTSIKNSSILTSQRDQNSLEPLPDQNGQKKRAVAANSINMQKLLNQNSKKRKVNNQNIQLRSKLLDSIQ